jgi:hypothetical protein
VYASEVIERNLDRERSRLRTYLNDPKFEFQRHTPAACQQAREHFDALIDSEGKMKRDLDRGEVKWILNERALCRYDFTYYATCNPPDAPILMADYTFCPIGEVREGDFVIGWSKKGKDTRSKFNRNVWRRSKVIAAKRRQSPIVRVQLRSGRVIRCTPDHLWANGGTSRHGHVGGKFPSEKFGKPWITVKKKRSLRKICDPFLYSELSEDQKRAAWWLAGIFDGEGTVGAGSQLTISQYQVHNPDVHHEIGRCLDLLGVEYSVTEKSYCITGGWTSRLKFLSSCRPIRAPRLLDMVSKTIHSTPDRIEDVSFDGWGEVCSLQTETGNYVAWGYLSKNCYYYIETPDNRLVLFEPTTPQLIQTEVMADLEREGKAIEILNLKARQVGITTDAECRVAHRVQFYSNVNAVVASSNPGKSALMADKMETAWAEMPWYLMPVKTRYNVGKLIEFGEQNSGVTIQSGAAFHGIARGQTPTVAHCSEVSEWNDPQNDIDNAMLRAMHANPELFVALESTALFMNDWWHNTWKAAKAGKNRFTPRFYGWYIAKQLYPTLTWLKKFPLPANWIPSDRIIRYAEKCRRAVLADPYLVNHLGSNWQLPREQMWYYEFEYEAAKLKHAVNDFLREMCGDENEAWQVTGISILDPDLLQAHSEGCKEPIGVYGFEAREDVIRKELQVNPRDVDVNEPPVEIECCWREGHEIEGRLVPLRDKSPKPIEEEAQLVRLFVYEWPRVGHQYGLALDSAEGIGADQTAIECFRRQTMTEVSEQVAEFASNIANAVDAVNLVMLIGALFSPPDKFNNPRQCKIIAERRSESDVTQLQLRLHGWSDFYQYLAIEDVRLDPNREHRIGFMTTAWSRRRVLAWLLYCLKSFLIQINSPLLIHELKTLHRDIYEQKIRAESGGYDDRVMAAAICWYTVHELDERQSNYQLIQMEQQANLSKEYATYPQPRQEEFEGWQEREESGIFVPSYSEDSMEVE